MESRRAAFSLLFVVLPVACDPWLAAQSTHTIVELSPAAARRLREEPSTLYARGPVASLPEQGLRVAPRVVRQSGRRGAVVAGGLDAFAQERGAADAPGVNG
jgi:hypothetical protein